MIQSETAKPWRAAYWLSSPVVGLALIEAVRLEALPGGLVLALTVWGVLGGALGIGGGYSIAQRWLLFPLVAISLDAAVLTYWVLIGRDILWPLAFGTRLIWLAFVFAGSFAGSRIARA